MSTTECFCDLNEHKITEKAKPSPKCYYVRAQYKIIILLHTYKTTTILKIALTNIDLYKLGNKMSKLSTKKIN